MLKKNINGGTILIIIITIIIVVGGTFLLVKINPNDINNTLLKDVPILKEFLKDNKDEEQITLEEKYYEYSKPRLKEAVIDLEKDKIKLEGDIKSLKIDIQNRDKEINNLKEMEKEYLEMKQSKIDYETKIAIQNEELYLKYFNKLNKKRAEEIYKELIKSDVKDVKVKSYISNFETMDAQAAAKVLEELVRTDLDIVVKVINCLDSDIAGKILNNMDAKNAAKITKKIAG